MHSESTSSSTTASSDGTRTSSRRFRRARCQRRCCFGVCVASAVICIGVGAAIALGFDRAFSEHLKTLMPLANGSMSYQGWEKVPNEIYFQVWLFNVTNPHAIVSEGAAPALQQLGPFTFIEARQKRDIHFHDNGTVSFREFFRYNFRPDLSIGELSNFTVTSVNMPYIVTSFRMRYSSIFLRKIINTYLKTYSGGLFVTRTAREILLGYRDPALTRLDALMKTLGQPFQSTTGLFVGQNDTDKGLMLVNTGSANLAHFNRVERWKGADQLSLWSQDWANQISGTDGSMFPPPVRPSDRLTLFVPDICRPIDLVYNGSHTIEGIPVLRFRPPPELLMNATLWPPNQAFCQPNCMDTGVLNITACQDGIPIVVSSPHFFGAPTYQTTVNGLNPTQDMETEVSVEPNTGFVLGAQRKMQTSVLFQRVEGFDQTDKLNASLLLMPLMWLNESARIEPGKAALFRLHLLTPIQAATWSQWVLIALGLALAFPGLSLLAWRRWLRPQHPKPRLRKGAERGRGRGRLADPAGPKPTATATTTLRLMDEDAGSQRAENCQEIGGQFAVGCTPVFIECDLDAKA